MRGMIKMPPSSRLQDLHGSQISIH